MGGITILQTEKIYFQFIEKKTSVLKLLKNSKERKFVYYRKIIKYFLDNSADFGHKEFKRTRRKIYIHLIFIKIFE